MSIAQIFLKKLGFLDKIFSKKQFYLFATKFIRISINFVANKKNCFLLKILSRKPSFL